MSFMGIPIVKESAGGSLVGSGRESVVMVSPIGLNDVEYVDWL